MREELPQLNRIAEELLDAEKHYLREENVLFPVLEKHGITEPPAMMWMEHNQLGEEKKQLKTLIENGSLQKSEKSVAEFWIRKGDRLIHIRTLELETKTAGIWEQWR